MRGWGLLLFFGLWWWLRVGGAVRTGRDGRRRRSSAAAEGALLQRGTEIVHEAGKVSAAVSRRDRRRSNRSVIGWWHRRRRCGLLFVQMMRVHRPSEFFRRDRDPLTGLEVPRVLIRVLVRRREDDVATRPFAQFEVRLLVLQDEARVREPLLGRLRF